MASNPQCNPQCIVLMAVLVCVSQAAGQLIRDITTDGEDLRVKNKCEDAQGKPTADFDPQTLSDLSSQILIVSVLQHFCPDVNIVAEEGDIDASALPAGQYGRVGIIIDLMKELNVEQMVARLPAGLVVRLLNSSWNGIQLRDLEVYVDPLDGTREYVNGNYKDVTSLIGICYNHKPIGGIVAQVFGDECYLGFSFCGVYKVSYTFDDDSFCPRLTDDAVVTSSIFEEGCPYSDFKVVSSRNSRRTQGKTMVSLDMLKHMDKITGDVIYCGGAGSKFLKLLSGQANCWIFAANAISLWDSCAGTALMEELGGRVTDTNGKIYVYRKDAPSYICANGVVVTSSHERHMFIIDNVTKHLDVLLPYDVAYFRDNTSLSNVQSFCVERSIYGQKSVVLFLAMRNSDLKEFKCVFKRSSRKVLGYLNPSYQLSEWQAVARSLNTEYSVYNDPELAKYMPSIYASAFTIDNMENHVDFDYTLIMEIIPSGVDVLKELSLENMQSVIKALSDLHNRTNKKILQSSCPDMLNECGTFWRQQQDMGGFADRYEAIRTTFCEDLAVPDRLRGSLNDCLGKRLCDLYPKLIKLCNKKEVERKNLPLLHGNTKASNMSIFGDRVVMVDWAWSGPGLGIFDIVQFIHSSINDFPGLRAELEPFKLYNNLLESSYSEYDLYLLYNVGTVLYGCYVIGHMLFHKESKWIERQWDQPDIPIHNRSYIQLANFFENILDSMYVCLDYFSDSNNFGNLHEKSIRRLKSIQSKE